MWIEIILILIILWIIFFFILQFLDKLKLKKLREKYDKEKDLSRKGEEIGRGLRKASVEFSDKEFSVARPDTTSERGVLSPEPSRTIGENSNSKRRTGKSFKGIFRKLRRR
jgi:hypothetical protein